MPGRSFHFPQDGSPPLDCASRSEACAAAFVLNLLRAASGRKRARESAKDCLHREIKEELPKLNLGRVRLWKEVKAKNRRSGRKMSDAIFVTAKAAGRMKIGDKKEIDKAIWRKPRGIRLTPTSRYIRDKRFPKSN
jgi:8-oxo-dGTP diphosphatase